MQSHQRLVDGLTLPVTARLFKQDEGRRFRGVLWLVVDARLLAFGLRHHAFRGERTDGDFVAGVVPVNHSGVPKDDVRAFARALAVEGADSPRWLVQVVRLRQVCDFNVATGVNLEGSGSKVVKFGSDGVGFSGRRPRP